MKDKDNIYCAFCGAKNIIEDNKCKKCNKKLNPYIYKKSNVEIEQ